MCSRGSVSLIMVCYTMYVTSGILNKCSQLLARRTQSHDKIKFSVNVLQSCRQIKLFVKEKRLSQREGTSYYFFCQQANLTTINRSAQPYDGDEQIRRRGAGSKGEFPLQHDLLQFNSSTAIPSQTIKSPFTINKSSYDIHRPKDENIVYCEILLATSKTCILRQNNTCYRVILNSVNFLPGMITADTLQLNAYL